MTAIHPSILSADFADLRAELLRVPGSDAVHVDVMDNHFVPNLTMGLPVVKALRAATTLPLDIHLMIEDPDRWAPPYAEAGCESVTFHAEAARDHRSLIRDITSNGAAAAMALKPGTAIADYRHIIDELNMLLIMTVEPGFGGQEFMPQMLEKIRTARQIADGAPTRLAIQVDGGINADTIALAAEAGADTFVAGSAVFSASSPDDAIAMLRQRAQGHKH